MRFLSWNCKLRTRLSDIVLMHLHIHNNYRQIVTQQVQKRFFYNVILKCFQNHRRGKWCKLFSFLSKWFGNLKKDVVNKRLVNSVKYHYLCTYQCKSRGGGGVQARGGDLMPETSPLSGFWSCEGTPGSGHLILTDRSLVSIQKQLPNPSLEAFWKSRCWRKVWSFHLF